MHIQTRQFRNYLDITKGKTPLLNARDARMFIVLISKDGIMWLV